MRIPAVRRHIHQRGRGVPAPFRSRRLAVGVITLTGALAAAVLPSGAAAAAPAPPPAAAAPDLGPNVLVFDPSMPTSQIQSAVDAVAAQQVNNQFGTQRYALLFKPGTYGTAADPLNISVGYYTEVAGLGLTPGEVTINGTVNVNNQCDGSGSCTALNNFWRSLSNLRINAVAGSSCQDSNELWAASQASPVRRVDVAGNFFLFDYCSNPGYASGGFIADSAFSGGTVINATQQQYYTRNSALDGWTNGVWNQVFSGDPGAPPTDFPSANQYTTLPTTPVSREKPYLYVDSSGGWNVFVPAARRNSTGTTWQAGPTPGRSIPLRDFSVARPSDPPAKINSALAQGRNLLLTPGVYDVARTLEVKRAEAVVLGLGMATLTAQHGAVALSVADVPGVDIAGITIDAGPVTSPVLLQVGSGHDKGGPHRADPADPTALQDVFFRIGGPHVGKATTSLVVNTPGTVLDDIWAWRADHGTGVGWTVNTADTGLVVNGDDVTATGLFVEHYQKYEVIWNGERGRTVFFQNELPYDPPNQAAWQHDGILGWAAYKVSDRVRTHEAWGMGSYIFTNVDPTIHASHAFEVPVTPGVRMHDLLTIELTKPDGTIDHVVNDVGAPVGPANPDTPSDVVSYP